MLKGRDIYVSDNAGQYRKIYYRGYFTILTGGLYSILLIMRLLANMIKDIPSKYLFLMILLLLRDLP